MMSLVQFSGGLESLDDSEDRTLSGYKFNLGLPSERLDLGPNWGDVILFGASFAIAPVLAIPALLGSIGRWIWGKNVSLSLAPWATSHYCHVSPGREDS
jgi:hypothetical protein